MASGENKEELVKFLFTSWKNVDASLLRGVEVILSHEDTCHRFIQSNEQLTYSEVEELTRDHEEADTRMIAHARHASLFYHNIVINARVQIRTCSSSHLVLLYTLMRTFSSKRRLEMEDVLSHLEI